MFPDWTEMPIEDVGLPFEFKKVMNVSSPAMLLSK